MEAVVKILIILGVNLTIFDSFLMTRFKVLQY